ncbi:glycosyltransferase family 2 protein [Cellulosilyticum sp. I15G10I2]|uniref:glycosyltransferase family 2 protein n=1 Tax=Cellulosilyticum sp. I15G10I2 TaxID=1892843 RepID=UPI00085CCD8C|nr:glycosyltransferase family 2 protein [Cellulosilyticum sp. I15G10I2]
MPLLSIVIPVYNVENYLDECINSILNQNFDDYEVILVDDASTDSSGRMCDEYASKYKNITTIHLEENSLPAGARNVGIKNAIGKYIHFCDSDDWYIKDSFLNISEVLKKNSPDVLVGQFICKPERGAFLCNDVDFNSEIFRNPDSDIIVEHFLSFPKFTCTTCRFIINRDFLIKNDLKFLEGYHVEDEEWFPKVVCYAQKFSLIKEPFYCYRPRANGSITSSKTYLHSKAHLVLAMRLLNFAEEKKYESIRRQYIISRVTFLLGLFATRCDTFDLDQIQELSVVIEDNIDVIKAIYKTSPEIELFDFVCRHGSYMGLYLYQKDVIERTLEIVAGKDDKDIYIFPTGYNGEGTARILKSAGYNVKGFLDNSHIKEGCIIDGIQVYLPSVLKGISMNKMKNIFVIVSIQQKDISEILKKQLKSLGLGESQFDNRIY